VLKSWNGRTFNSAAMGRELGVSRPTVVAYMDALARVKLVRLLPFHEEKRRPVLYLCSSSSGACIESIVDNLSRAVPKSSFYWWKTGRVRQIDLVADLGTERIGFNFLETPMTRRRDWLPLEIAFKRGVIQRGFLLYAGTRAFVVGRIVQALPLHSFIRDPGTWILRRRTLGDAEDLRLRINLESLARAAGHR
jgi:hypothetical protein